MTTPLASSTAIDEREIEVPATRQPDYSDSPARYLP